MDLEYLAFIGRIESHNLELGLPATVLGYAFIVEWLTGSFVPIVWFGLKKVIE
jgi:hypothetical protein